VTSNGKKKILLIGYLMICIKILSFFLKRNINGCSPLSTTQTQHHNTEDWSNDDDNSALPTGINYFKIQINYLKS